MSGFDRRRVLRGMLNGGAVTVALPLLNCFLDGNGAALANGAPMPVRFGTWFWGLGMNKSVFVPKTTGANYELPLELAALKDVQQHVNLFTNFNVLRDGNPNLCHYTGWVALRTGGAPAVRGDMPGETIDVTIARKIGGGTRFRSLEVAATGDIHDSHSYQGQDAVNTPDVSPVDFYHRLFGPDFQDPNSPTFKPNPRIMAQKSVLSGVLDQSRELNRSLGAEDRARLDQYYTGLREVERQLDNQLEKPLPIAACVSPKPPKADPPNGLDSTLVSQRHRMMTDLLVMAVACNQTRVFNMLYANSFAGTIKAGYERAHHATTHEEVIDERIGYQPMVSWFTQRAMEEWAYYVKAFAAVPEGDGTLLDNTLIYCNSDQEFAKIHSLEGIPMFTAGKAGGRIKTGLHVSGAGGPGTRLGYTVQRIMGVDISEWGTQSNKVSKEIGEIIV
jgi:hypothetical protein